MIRTVTFQVTTTAGGAGSDTRPVRGKILRIDTSGADTAGADVVWSTPAVAGSNILAETVLTLTDLGTASAVDYPRRTVDSAVGAALSTTGDLKVEPFIAAGLVTMTVAEGGNAKTYTGSVTFDDGQ